MNSAFDIRARTKPRLVMLSGSCAGIGKSTLAEGLARRLEEGGAAVDLFGEHQIFTRADFADVAEAFRSREYPTPDLFLRRSTSFSVTAGLKKPDPAIYRQACSALSVEPSECLYIGDGDSNELAGAEALGMHAVRLAPGNNSESCSFDTATWVGKDIPSLAATLDLL